MSKSKKERSGPRPTPRMDRSRLRSVLASIRDESLQEDVDATIRRIVREAENPGGDLAALSAYDLDPHVSRVAFLFLLRILKAEVVSPAIAAAAGKSAVPVLLQALRDPSLPDDRKLALPALCSLAGCELSRDEASACFKDFEGAMKRSMIEVTSAHSDQPDGILKFLFGLHLVDVGEDDAAPSQEALETGIACCTATRDANPSLSASALGVLVAIAAENNFHSDHLDAALDALAAIRSERASWCLAELGRWPALGALGAKARALAARLAAEGVAPRFNLLAEFSHGSVSAVDGAGMRSLTLFFRTPEGSLDAALFLLSDDRGVKAVTYLPEEGSGLEEQLRGAPGGLPFAPCTLDFARDLVADAWAVQEERGGILPSQLFLVRPHLGSDAIVPRHRTPDLAAYALEAMARSQDLARDSLRLLNLPQYGSLYFSSDAAYDFLSGVAPKRGGRVPRKHLETFAREIAIQERGLLLARMAANLEVESLAGRADQPLNRLAASTWLAMSENVVPFHEIPYVSGLCNASVEMITANLAMGFRTQAEANRAALEMDDTLGPLADDFFGELDEDN